MRSYALEEIMAITTKNKNNENNQNNSNSNFVASPKGTKPFPFFKKCRTISKKNKTILVTIPQEICHLLKIEEGDNFRVYCDMETNQIIAEKL